MKMGHGVCTTTPTSTHSKARNKKTKQKIENAGTDLNLNGLDPRERKLLQVWGERHLQANATIVVRMQMSVCSINQDQPALGQFCSPVHHHHHPSEASVNGGLAVQGLQRAKQGSQPCHADFAVDQHRPASQPRSVSTPSTSNQRAALSDKGLTAQG
jgi:hypothetical protein